MTANMPVQTSPREVIAARIRQTITAVVVTVMQPPTIERGLAVKLGKSGFSITWGIILFFHLVNAFYTLARAFIYILLSFPRMEDFISRYHLLRSSWYIYITIVYSVISLVNFYQAFKMIMFSICYRELVFKKRRKLTQSIKPPITPKKARRWCICLSRRVTSPLSRLHRALSVKGQFFDEKLLLQELAEVATQTYQAYVLSAVVCREWMSQLFSAIVCVNCIANTAIHIYKEDEIGMRRFLSIAVDLFLEFLWGYTIPAYVMFYLLPIGLADNLPLDTNFLMVEMTLNVRQFFIASWQGAFLTPLPYLSMLASLSNMKTLLDIEEPGLQDLESASSDTDIDDQGGVHLSKVDGNSYSSPTPTLTIPQPKKKSILRRFWFMPLLPLFGLVVLGISIASSVSSRHKKCSSGCKVAMRPWLATGCTCAVFELNCYDRNIVGHASEVREIFTELDNRSLNELIITHCPSLTVPKEFHRFDALTGIEFYNVTIVDWPREAAIASSFDTLDHISIARSDISKWPEGLTYHTVSSLTDVQISASVIGPPPDDLDAKWPSVWTISFDFCGLHELPMVLTRMQLREVSLVGNNISAIPEDLPRLSWMLIYLDRNPLARLPDKGGAFVNLSVFSIQDTKILSLPHWLLDSYGIVYGYQTEICANPPNHTVFAHCEMRIDSINGISSLLERDAFHRITTDAATPAYPTFYSA